MPAKENIFDRVTNKIIADIETGVAPWQKPWSIGNISAPLLRPKRHNGEYYNGMNILLLWDAADANHFYNPTWMTFKQAQEYGANVRKGEKGSLVVYSNKLTKTETDEATGEEFEKHTPYMKGYTVFNVEQIEGLPEHFYFKPEPPNPADSKTQRIEGLEQFFKGTGAIIRHGGDKAFYAPSRDIIQMPPVEAFINSESYYATLGHEVIHWTSHKSRLDRSFGKVATWGDENYAKEELVAEIGSAFLCADLAITPETRADHAAYVSHWLKTLKNDKRFIFSAAAHASRATEYLKAQTITPRPIIAPYGNALVLG